MEKQYNLDAVGNEKSFLPVSFCLKVVFAVRSAAVHLLVLPYWPSRVGSESPKLSLLVLPLVGFPRASVVASGRRGSGGQPRGNGNSRKNVEPSIAGHSFQLHRGVRGPASNSHVAATPAENTAPVLLYLLPIHLIAAPGPHHVPRHVVSCSIQGPNITTPRWELLESLRMDFKS